MKSEVPTRPVPTVREAARVLLLDEQGRLLLWRVEDPNIDIASLWITVGGGLEPGESFEEAALRELAEETGLTDVHLGPWVWSRRHVFSYGDGAIESIERFFLVQTTRFDVGRAGHDEYELAFMKEHRWWASDEIASANTEVFVPRNLAEHLKPLVSGIIPSEPLDLGA